MTVAYIFEVEGMTGDQYDGIMEAMGVSAKGAIKALGAVAHIAGPSDGGWRVVDVWDSEEVADAFYASDTFAPVRAAAEGGGMTKVTWPVHRIEV